MTNPSSGLPHPVRRVSPTSPNSAAITSSMLPIHCGESSSDRQAMRRVPPELSKPVRRVPPDRHAGIELLRLPQPVQTNAASYPPKVTQFAELRSEQKKLTALTIGNEGIQMQWHSRAHTRKHEAALPPVLMFFYNFFINIILFYYWVTNRDFIDLFCHTPQT